jgi:hypothetical protein
MIQYLILKVSFATFFTFNINVLQIVTFVSFQRYINPEGVAVYYWME